MNNSSLTNRPSYHINLVVYYWENCIGISKDAIKALNKPKYISLRVNTKLRSIAIIPCTQNDPMSFEVPQKLFTDHRCCFRIHSKAFKEWIQMLSGADNTRTYTIEGEYSEKNNLVYFPIGKARIRDLHNRVYNECRFQTLLS
jgi:hypothetical protein